MTMTIDKLVSERIMHIGHEYSKQGPKYSSNLVDAWLVYDKFKGKKLGPIGYDPFGQHWFVMVANDGEEYKSVDSYSVEMAICLGILKIHNVEVPGIYQ